ncbi:MAG: hypothetical protein AAFN27_08625 [Pseudomonadota bacterium]
MKSDKMTPDGLPCETFEIFTFGEEIPGHRVLTPEFLTLILTQEPWPASVSQPQVRIACADVPRHLTLENARVDPAAHIARSRFGKGINLDGAIFARSLSLFGSTVHHFISANDLRLNGNFVLNSLIVIGNVDLVNAKIGGFMSLSSPIIMGSIDADLVSIGSGFFVRDGAHVRNLDLLGARIVGDLVVQSSTIVGSFDASDVTIGGNLVLNQEGSFQNVDLRNANIGSQIIATDSRFTGKFHAPNIVVEGNIFFRGGASFSDVDLSSAIVKGTVQLAGSEFAGTFDLSGGEIGELILFRPGTIDEDHANSDDPIWLAGGQLVLRNLQAHALQARSTSWRRARESEWIEADLSGLQYERLGGYRADQAPTLIDEGAEELVGWLEGVRPERMVNRYTPGPYEHLVELLRQEGLGAKADAVEYAKFEHRSATPPGGTPWWDRLFFWPLSKYLVGYGVYPFWLLLYVAGLIGLGWLVALFSYDNRLSAWTFRSAFDRLWYSVENALPLIELSERHKQINHCSAWVESFYHIQKLLGFVLATYLVGALTILAV